MKNTFGQSVTLTLFGESHGPAVGAVLDGLAPGLPVDEEFLRRQLARRRPATAMDTPRREPDNYQILSGVWQGRTTGTPRPSCSTPFRIVAPVVVRPEIVSKRASI